MTPFTELERLFDQLQQNLEQASRRRDAGPFEGDLPAPTSARLDLEDRGDELVLYVDLPGFERDEIDVRVTGDAVTVEAQQETESELEERDYLRRERRRGSVTRSIRLPEAVETDEATGNYEDGVLTVRMPKQSGAEGTSIEIE